MTFDDTITELKKRFESAGYDQPVEHVYEGLARRRRRRRLSLAAATTAAVTVLVVLSPFSSERAAIAGWTPEPHSADSLTVRAADPSCRRSLFSAGLPDIGAPVWTDLRGNGLVLAYPSDSAVGVCMQVDQGRGFSAEGAAVVVAELQPLNGVLRIDSVAGFDHGTAGVTAVIGQASPKVARVVVTAPGWTADASRYKGYWLAWWPTATDAADISVVAFDVDGRLIETWSPKGQG